MAGFQVARRVFAGDYNDQAGQDTAANRRMAYAYYRALYDNRVFDDVRGMIGYKSNYGLYKGIRSIYNPTRRAVNFYASFVYPGVLTVDGDRLPSGARLAIPLADDMDPAVREAIGTLWKWSNWQANKSVWVRWGAMCGDAFAHVLDDPARGRVMIEAVSPAEITALDLDPAGSVLSYTREYTAVDEAGQRFTYRKDVTPDTIRTYRDNRLQGFGDMPAEYDNPYGFAPAVWVPFRSTGGKYGSPVAEGVVNKLDELNGHMSVIHDRMAQIGTSPILLKTGVAAGGILAANKPKAEPPTTENMVAARIRGDLPVLEVAKDAGIESVGMDLADALEYARQLIGEIEQDMPETKALREMRAMSEVSGPAARRLLADVDTPLTETQAQFDRASADLFAMALAIGGWRQTAGEWGPSGVQTSEQAAFRPFTLDDYRAGRIRVDILPRPMIQDTAMEIAETVAARRAAGISQRRALAELGIPEDEIDQELEDAAAARRDLGAQLLTQFDRGTADGAQDPADTADPAQAGRTGGND